MNVVVANPLVVLLREKWQPRDYPCYGWWDVVYVALVFALIIAFSYWTLRDKDDV